MDGRTVYLDGDKLRALRIVRGWRVEDLAQFADCSERSVRNAESGRRISVNTYALIAKAIGAKAGELMRVLENPVEPSKFRMQITVEGDMRVISKLIDFDQFAALLTKMLSASTDVKIIDVKAGSVIIELELSEADALKLVVMFPDFHEHARDAIYEQFRKDREGIWSNFMGSRSLPDPYQFLDVLLLTFTESVRELRVLAIPDIEKPDAATPES